MGLGYRMAGQAGVPDRGKAGLAVGLVVGDWTMSFLHGGPSGGREPARVVTSRGVAERVEHHHGVGHGGVDGAEAILAVEALGDEGDGLVDGGAARAVRQQGLGAADEAVDHLENRAPGAAVGTADPVLHLVGGLNEQLGNRDTARIAGLGA